MSYLGKFWGSISALLCLCCSMRHVYGYVVLKYIFLSYFNHITMHCFMNHHKKLHPISRYVATCCALFGKIPQGLISELYCSMKEVYGYVAHKYIFFPLSIMLPCTASWPTIRNCNFPISRYVVSRCFIWGNSLGPYICIIMLFHEARVWLCGTQYFFLSYFNHVTMHCFLNHHIL